MMAEDRLRNVWLRRPGAAIARRSRSRSRRDAATTGHRRNAPARCRGTVREYWVRARKAVGAGDVRLHDLRHLTAMTLVDEGRSEASVRETMRHANVAMTAKDARRRDRGENAKAMADALLRTGS